MYVHGFGTDDSYDDKHDEQGYGYGHIDPYLNANHGYGYTKGYGYEKDYGYEKPHYGKGQYKHGYSKVSVMNTELHKFKNKINF